MFCSEISNQSQQSNINFNVMNQTGTAQNQDQANVNIKIDNNMVDKKNQQQQVNDSNVDDPKQKGNFVNKLNNSQQNNAQQQK
jgi:hypothetical protein